MNRTIIYSQEQPRSFDFVQWEHDVLLGLGFSIQDLLGGTTTVLSGFAGTQTTVASLTINLAAGRVYQVASADAVSVGAITQDLTQIVQQGFYAAAQITLSTAGIAAGQSRWALVEAQFSQSDVVRPGDPNGGIPPFYNSANPSQPLNGQGGLGLQSPTERSTLAVIQVITGAAATTGSEVPPTVTGGWVPLYLIDLAYGQTQITTAQILTAGPSVGTNVPSNYPYAPFLAGLLASHHSGNPGQAPKVNLNNGLEVQGTLPASQQQRGMQAYTTAGTYSFIVPAGVTAVDVEVWGGGSGSAAGYNASNFASAGGAGGGYSRKRVTGLIPGGTVTVTVGAAGAAGTTSVLPTAGGTSSFGAYCSATGGYNNGSLTLTNPCLTAGGGTGTGGDINATGSWSQGPVATINGAGNSGGNGGAAAFGGGGGSGNVGVSQNGGFPGGGGGGVGPSTTTGSAGAAGCVYVRW
jgi:hypothetical protein